MSKPRLEVGFVSGDPSFVRFLVEVFEFEELPEVQLPFGSLHAMQGDGVVVKVLVPSESPKPAERARTFYGVEGLRFLTIRVDEDLDAVLSRAVARGARVEKEPTQVAPGKRFAILSDPNGNMIEVSQGPA